MDKNLTEKGILILLVKQWRIINEGRGGSGGEEEDGHNALGAFVCQQFVFLMQYGADQLDSRPNSTDYN